jgi:hypothetical protein
VSTSSTFVSILAASLDAVLPQWRQHIDELGQVRLIRARNDGWTPSDEEVLQGLLLAYLSAMTDWRKIQSNRDELMGVLSSWLPGKVANLTDTKLGQLERWFLSRGMGSVLLKKQLVWLRESAGVFVRMRHELGGIDDFLRRRSGSNDLAMMLGSPKSEWKLPGVGIPLAAEFLKNLGFDDFKPDRHLIRILGPKRLGYCKRNDTISIRHWGIKTAREAGLLAAELDQMLWLYCARGYGNTCSANPRCQACLMRSACGTGMAFRDSSKRSEI